MDLESIYDRVKERAEDVLGYSHTFFSNYVFHDLQHSRNMERHFKELRNHISLGYYETWLTAISIYLHDIGMALFPRNWQELGLTRRELSGSAGGDAILAKDDFLIGAMLREIGEPDLESAFFKDGVLSFPRALAENSWDGLSPASRMGLRQVIRRLHPWLGAKAAEKKFLREWPDVGLEVGRLIKHHSASVTEERSLDLGPGMVGGHVVDTMKMSALLQLVDCIDCSQNERASADALWNLTRELLILDEEVDAIEMNEESPSMTTGRASHGFLSHWLFKQYVEKVVVRPGMIVLRSNTLSPALVAGLLFFEVAENVWPVYLNAEGTLVQKGISHKLVVEFPGPRLVVVDDSLMTFARELLRTHVTKDELDVDGLQVTKRDEVTFPRALCLLLSSPNGEPYADEIASRYVRTLLGRGYTRWGLSADSKKVLEEVYLP
jgi:hypothetical protein